MLQKVQYVKKSIFFRDIDKRLKEHNIGKCSSTKGKGPWKLIYKEQAKDIKQARTREKFLKSGIGREFIKSILNK